ncbi:MAG: hypothetical protein IPL35_04265 [Sphingobacteriales bacterium]|nr:hypothetical protein [Sphingobacteriales bacterium]
MMPYNGLYVFVEGDDDERFFNAIIRPLIVSAFSFIKIIKYAQLNKKIQRLLSKL